MATIKKNLTHLDHYPRKDYGQNFLSNEDLINKIIDFITSKEINRVVEIGPGLGAITDKLKQSDKKLMLICIEKDKKLYENLQKKYFNDTNFQIINIDVLKIDLKKYVNNKTLIFGNLPYNIATKILIKYADSFIGSNTEALFMFQKEVADKIIAKKTKKSQLSTKINCFFKIEEFLRLNQSDFWPQPKIKSTMLHIIPKISEFNIRDIKKLNAFLFLAFQSNRRKLINNLSIEYDKQLLLKKFKFLKIKNDVRPENLTPVQYLNLFDIL
ncbi:ribosomal RNA small subunit methyltransferase A [bacterium]|nr:ribosomal RNA small subunit methyltransferase A [bacterium]